MSTTGLLLAPVSPLAGDAAAADGAAFLLLRARRWKRKCGGKRGHERTVDIRGQGGGWGWRGGALQGHGAGQVAHLDDERVVDGVADGGDGARQEDVQEEALDVKEAADRVHHRHRGVVRRVLERAALSDETHELGQRRWENEHNVSNTAPEDEKFGTQP